MSNVQVPPVDVPLTSPDQLLEHFRKGAKARSDWGVGMEYERLGLVSATGEAIPYSGAAGVEAVLDGIASRDGWERQTEAGRTIALARGGSSITLEPGGQMELSGKVHGNLFSMRKELAGHLAASMSVSDPLGVSWIAAGLQPLTPIERIEWVPKGRYKIMRPFLGVRGDLAHHMMKGTAGVQMNLDYSGEEEASELLRTAMGITSIVTAVCANSPVYASGRSGYLSRRAHIWTLTDPARCGLLEFTLREGASFKDYVEYALDVPVIFAFRGGRWMDLGGIPFRNFMDRGARGLQATMGDWELHLTTIFTEVRLKTYVEVRGADSVPPGIVMALAAFWKGILYDGAARRDAWDLVKAASFAQRLSFAGEAAFKGPAASLAGHTALDLARELVVLAREGLARAAAGREGRSSGDEATLLDPLEESLASDGHCPAASFSRLWAEGGPSAVIRAERESDRAFLEAEGLTAP